MQDMSISDFDDLSTVDSDYISDSPSDNLSTGNSVALVSHSNNDPQGSPPTMLSDNGDPPVSLTLDSFIPILSKLPDLYVDQNLYYIGDSSVTKDWEKLRNYAQMVSKFIVTDANKDSEARISPAALLRLARHQLPLLPSLSDLVIVDADASIAYLELLLTPSLKSLEALRIPDVQQSTFFSFLTAIKQEVPLFQTLILGPGRFPSRSLQIIPQFKNLRHLELKNEDSEIPCTFFDDIGSLLELETLILDARHVTPKSPSDSFPHSNSIHDKSNRDMLLSQTRHSPIAASCAFNQLTKLHIIGWLPLLEDLMSRVTSTRLEDISITLIGLPDDELQVKLAKGKAEKQMQDEEQRKKDEERRKKDEERRKRDEGKRKKGDEEKQEKDDEEKQMEEMHKAGIEKPRQPLGDLWDSCEPSPEQGRPSVGGTSCSPKKKKARKEADDRWKIEERETLEMLQEVEWVTQAERERFLREQKERLMKEEEKKERFVQKQKERLLKEQQERDKILKKQKQELLREKDEQDRFLQKQEELFRQGQLEERKNFLKQQEEQYLKNLMEQEQPERFLKEQEERERFLKEQEQQEHFLKEQKEREGLLEEQERLAGVPSDVYTLPFIQLLRMLCHRWTTSLKRVTVCQLGASFQQSLMPPTLPVEMFQELLHLPAIESLEVKGWILDSVESAFSVAESILNLRSLLLPLDETNSGVSLHTLRYIAETCPNLESFQCRIECLLLPYSFRATDALSHGLRMLFVGNSSPFPNTKGLYDIARHLYLLFPNLETIQTSEGHNGEQWVIVDELVKLCQVARMYDMNRPIIRPE